MQTKPVRTYLDPDAVGPLPRSALADDSDALSAARTVLRLPAAGTQEISADDVIEVVDPNRPKTSLAPVGYDTSIVLPRRRLGKYVLAIVGVALAILVVAAVESITPARNAAAPAGAPPPGTTAVVTAPPPATHAAAVVDSARPPAAAPASTTGTLRVETENDGERIYVDGVVLTAPAAILRCGPHDIALGAPGRTRTIEVPCGGEVTVLR